MSIRPYKVNGFWELIYYPDGRKKDPKTGKPNNKRERIIFEGTHAEAKLYYEELLKRAGKDRAPKIAPTLSEIWDDFLVEYATNSRPRTVTTTSSIWKHHIKKAFGHLRPAMLSPAIIEAYKAERVKQVKPKTVNNELNALAAILSWGVKHNRWDALTFKLPKFPPKLSVSPKPMVPSTEQVSAILHECGPRHFEFYSVMYGCGLRLDEAKNLRVEDVNIAARYIVIQGKGGKERFFPIPAGMIDLMTSIVNRAGSGYLWLNPDTGKPYSRPSDALKSAAKRAGINLRVYPHLLRHAFGVHGVLKGMNLRAIQLLMGHSTSRTTEIYTELAMEHLRAELEK